MAGTHRQPQCPISLQGGGTLSFYVVCQRPDKAGAKGYFGVQWDATNGERPYLTGIPARRYIYDTAEEAAKIAIQINLPYEIGKGKTDVEHDCPAFLSVSIGGN